MIVTEHVKIPLVDGNLDFSPLREWLAEHVGRYGYDWCWMSPGSDYARVGFRRGEDAVIFRLRFPENVDYTY